MPTTDVEMGRKGGSKRLANLQARKQILKVKGDYLELSDEDDDDDVVEVTEEPTPKRTFAKVVSSRRADMTLEMEACSDELSPAQLAYRRESLSTREQIRRCVDDLVKRTDGRLIHDTHMLTVVELAAFVEAEAAKLQSTAANNSSTTPKPVGRPTKTSAAAGTIASDPSTTYNTAPGQQSTRSVSPAPVAAKKRCIRIGSSTAGGASLTSAPTASTSAARPAASKPPSMTHVPIIRTELPFTIATPALPMSMPMQIVDLTGDERSQAADTKEMSFNKLQGKTFPSLVVVARPSLRSAPVGGPDMRGVLDKEVKRQLMSTPAQFTEFLMQQGLVKSAHFCVLHPQKKLKLGIYSDVTRFPFSGGYVWISECCPPKFVSVFHESIFDGTQPPTVNYKLIYHWACQTNVQNVLQWVKVDNVYLKGLYTWLRGICTAGLHTHLGRLGGRGKQIEVGVISLGTTTQDGANRLVKVEVLGIYDPKTRNMVLRAVDPSDTTTVGAKSTRQRLARIVEPVREWVHTDSTLVIDATIDMAALNTLGFLNVERSNAAAFNNSTIMDYLRRIVPRMFQNTLSLLSRAIIQQFLDELVWRELFGVSAYDAFNNIIRHIADQTRHTETGVTFFTRLNKIAANPFKNWSLASAATKKMAKIAEKTTGIRAVTRKMPIPITKALPPPPLVINSTAGSTTPNASRVAQIPRQITSLEPYYYGTIDAHEKQTAVELRVKCPICDKTPKHNIALLLHLFRHVSNAEYYCKYCLHNCVSKHNLYTHLELKHTMDTKAGRFFNCLICHDKFNSLIMLGKHMAIEHSPSELPYHCGSCSYKSSSHKRTVDHFYTRHANQSALQCPFCLRSVDLLKDGVDMVQAHAKSFLAHLSSHVRKSAKVTKKCARCDLQFRFKEELDAHTDRHISYRNEKHFVADPEPARGVNLVPKSLRDRSITAVQAPITFKIPDNCICKECGKKISADSHFKEVWYCNKGDCRYQTMCRLAVAYHRTVCVNMHKKAEEHPLGYELFCVCGYSSSNGNAMARHLVVCDRKSAYPSSCEASKAVVTPGMLDVLGLVRVDDSKEEETSKRRRRRRWQLNDSADEEEDADDPDYYTSDEEFQPNPRKKSKTSTATSSKSSSPPPLVKFQTDVPLEEVPVDGSELKEAEENIESVDADMKSGDNIEVSDVNADMDGGQMDNPLELEVNKFDAV